MTTATAVRDLATPRQLDFLSDLLKTKEIPTTEHDSISNAIVAKTLTKKSASIFISDLIKAPKKIIKAELPFGVPILNELEIALASVPKSAYAIPTEELDPAFFQGRLGNDLIFVEVKEYRDTLYMRKLSGSVGDFVRSKMDARDQLMILELIKQDPEKYCRMFGEHFSVCGCCKAKLTDEMSRKLFLGPTCRTYYGYDYLGNRVA